MSQRIVLFIGTMLVAMTCIACSGGDLVTTNNCLEPRSRSIRFYVLNNHTSLTLKNGEAGNVSLEYEDACEGGSYNPARLSATAHTSFSVSFSENPIVPDAVTGNGRSIMTITNNGAAPGTYWITVAAVAGIPPTHHRVDTLGISITVPGSGGTPCAGWIHAMTAPQGPYLDMHFMPGSSVGYVTTLPGLNNDPTLHKTTDAGRTWSSTRITTFAPEKIYFASESHGYSSTSGFGFKLYRSVDAGTTWEQVTSWPQEEIGDMLFTDLLTGFVLGRNSQKLWKTTDQGMTWEVVPIPSIGRLYEITSPSENRLVIAGDAGLDWSSDGGATWHNATAPMRNYYWVAFFDANNGIAGGRTLARTTDGGATWEALTDAAPISTGGAATPGGATGYAVGNEIWMTRDRGASWERSCAPPGQYFFRAAVTPEGRTVTVGSVMYRRE